MRCMVRCHVRRTWWIFLFLFIAACSSSESGSEPEEGKVLSSIIIAPASQFIAPAETVQYTATGIFSDNSTKDLSTSVVWSSSDTDIAAISDNGQATAFAAGTTTITATSGTISGVTTLTVSAPGPPTPGTSSVIIDHTCIRLDAIPVQWIHGAKADLHIAYGHTSHGSQVTTGMRGLVTFKGDLFRYNAGGINGALDLRDMPFAGALDLGNPTRVAWAAATRVYLDAHPEVNVVMWSWCGQVSTASEADIATYLALMTDLETEYPQVMFVYMTGHLDGTGLAGNLHRRNEQIRVYCRSNGKILYDFADIETYDPDGTYYGDRFPTDGCNYDYNSDGVTSQAGDPARPLNGDRNWAVDWQNSHVEGVDWYNCPAAHTQPLNANMKAYAAWWLWARLAGWDGK